MSQYLVSASIKILLKNIINWISFLMIIMSFFSKSFWTWKIMILKFFFFETSTSINVDFIVLKWIKKLDLLNLICKYSYDWYFALIDWFINVFLKNVFLKLFLIDFFFSKKSFCDSVMIQRFEYNTTHNFAFILSISNKFWKHSKYVKKSIKLLRLIFFLRW